MADLILSDSRFNAPELFEPGVKPLGPVELNDEYRDSVDAYFSPIICSVGGGDVVSLNGDIIGDMNATTVRDDIEGRDVFHFNGSTEITLPNNSFLFTTGVTVAFFMRTSSTAKSILCSFGGGIACRINNPSSGNLQFFFKGTSGASGGDPATPAYSVSCNDTDYHYIVATNNGTTTFLYFDGALLGSYGDTLYDLSLLDRPTTIGGQWTGVERFSGQIDDFLILGRFVDSGEALALYQNPYLILRAEGFVPPITLSVAPGTAITRAKESTLSAIIQQQNILRTASLNVVLRKTEETLLTVAGALQQNGLETSTLLGMVLQDGKTKAVTVGGLISKTSSVAASLAVALEDTFGLNADMTTALQKYREMTTELNAVLAAAVVNTADLNAMLAQFTTVTLSLNGLLQATVTTTSTLNVSLQDTFLQSVNLSVILQQIFSETVTLEGLLKGTNTTLSNLQGGLQNDVAINTTLETLIVNRFFHFLSLEALLAGSVFLSLAAQGLLLKTETVVSLLNVFLVPPAGSWPPAPDQSSSWSNDSSLIDSWVEEDSTPNTWN